MRKKTTQNRKTLHSKLESDNLMSQPLHRFSPFHKELGTYIREKRIKANMSQFEVAQGLGYKSAQFISNIERGLCSPPFPVLCALVNLYKISPREITDFLLSLQRKFLSESFAKYLKPSKRNVG